MIGRRVSIRAVMVAIAAFAVILALLRYPSPLVTWVVCLTVVSSIMLCGPVLWRAHRGFAVGYVLGGWLFLFAAVPISLHCAGSIVETAVSAAHSWIQTRDSGNSDLMHLPFFAAIVMFVVTFFVAVSCGLFGEWFLAHARRAASCDSNGARENGERRNEQRTGPIR